MRRRGQCLRGSFTADWQRNWLLPGGLLGGIKAQYAADIIETQSDSQFDATILRGQPTLATELRWPWVKSSTRASYVIEPIAQIVWAPDTLESAPNEDSTEAEFDEGNLFSLSRYPGEDARETGLRANLGLSWTRYDASGWSLSVLAGRILRQRDLNQFDISNKTLSGIRSDWLLSSQLSTSKGVTFSNRMLFDDDFKLAHDELRLGWANDRYAASAGYLWMDATSFPSLDSDLSELMLDTSWDWGSGWKGSFASRYDFTAQRMATTKLGLEYRNECVLVDLSLSRRFTSSTSVSAETEFGLSVQLAGFGSAQGSAVRRMCAR